MTAKKSLRLLMLLVVCLTSAATGHSEPNTVTTQSSTKKGDGILDSIRKIPQRKRMPSRNFLEIHYENGMLTLESETMDGCFSLEIAGEENSVYEVIPSMEIGESVSIDLELGQYSITATDVNGMQFAGEMCVY